MTAIRPTRRSILWLAMSLPLALLLGVLTPDSWALTIVYLAALAMAFGIDFILGLRRRDIAVAIAAPDALEIGETGHLVATLSARRAAGDLLCAAKLDLSRPLLPAPVRVSTWRTQESLALAIPLRAIARGEAALDALSLRWQGPLGLCERQDHIALDRKVAIVPNIRSLRDRALNLSLRDALFGQKAQKIGGDGSEFDSLQEFVAGRDRRRIDWKHSARHMKLLSKEFRAERNHRIVLAFDSGHLMREPLPAAWSNETAPVLLPKLDHAIGAGLLLAYNALKSGDRVGLYAFDALPRQYAEPRSGIGTLQRLQRLAGEIEYRAIETNFTLGLASLVQRLDRRACIVLMTDFVDTVTAELMVENVARLTRHHLVIFVTLADPALAAIAENPASDFVSVTRAVVAHDIRRDRQIVLERLRRLGVSVIEASAPTIGPDLLNRYIEIKKRDLL